MLCCLYQCANHALPIYVSNFSVKALQLESFCYILCYNLLICAIICFKVVKVADFGVARFQNIGGVMTAETGTYRWMAPEVARLHS